MRVYHFVNEEFGLDDLRRQRLKIATLNELNDPFEFFSVALGDEGLRRAFKVMKDEFAVKRGLLCFSRSWQNPVQWSHYADRHRGLCFGFDVPDELLTPVRYSRRRLAIGIEQFRAPRQMNEKTKIQLFTTKYVHWRYENEVRCLANIEERDKETGLYFAEFSEQLLLKRVIVGVESNITRQTLASALGEVAPNIECFKARLAFHSFRLVRQNREDLWL